MKTRTVNTVGRPNLPIEEKRRVRSIKMSDKEWEEIQNLAAKETMSASKYIRVKVLGTSIDLH
jgi:hypothetical protein